MPGGLELDPPILDPGPLATRGQVHTPSGTNIATVVGLTPGSFDPVAGPVFFGLNVAGPAAPFFMTPTQSTAILNLFTSSLQGLVPGSGGGTTNFLRADGTWAAPPGGGGSAHIIRANGSSFTARAGLNFLDTTTIAAAGADDAGGNETEVTFTLKAFAGGDVTSSANSLVLTIANNAVTNAKAADMAALTVKANATNATADPSDVAASADDTVFRRTATTLNWGQLTVGMAPNDLWTYAKIQNVSATSRILGRITAGAGDIEELTGTQATTLLDNFTSALKGLAPASGGGTTNFLRADGTWAAPPGTGTVGHIIQDNTVNETQRAALNFNTTTSIVAIVTDDGANNRSTVTLERAAFTGDVTSSQNSNVMTIPNDTVTYAKMQNVSATSRFLGRITAGAGDTEELTGTQATTLLDNFTSALKGLAPASGGGTTNFLRADGTWAAPPDTNTGHVIRDDNVGMTQRGALNFVSTATISTTLVDDSANNETEVQLNIPADAVTNALLADATALSVKGNATNVAANPTDIASSADDTIFRRTATTLNWGQLTVGMAPNDLWTYAKIQNVSATSRILGRITAGAGDIEELTGTQTTTLLDNFTSALKGLAPASGGGTTNFLRADGTWAAPPGSFTALSGAIVSTGTGGATTFAGILDNGVAENNRTNLNFVSGTNATVAITDDSVNDELEIAVSVTNFPLTGLAAVGANTIVANATAGSAAPTAVAVSADNVLARVGGNLVSHPWSTLAGGGLTYSAGVMAVGAGTGLTVNANDVQLSTIATDTFLGNRTAGTAVPTATLFSDVAGPGIAWSPSSHWFEVRTASGSHLTVDDASLQTSPLRFSKERIRDTWWEEFTFAQTLAAGTNVTTSGTVANGQTTNWWMVAGGATGVWSTVNVGATAGHPGIWRLTTGGASGNALQMYNGVAQTLGFEIYRGQDIFQAEAIIRINAVTTKIWEFGFRDQAGNNFIEFYADTSAGVGSTTLIHTLTREGGVSTDNNTAITDTANAWIALTILQETLGTIDFYIDDVLTNSHTTNVPDSEPMGMYFQVATRGAVTRSLDIDYVMFESQNLGASNRTT